jgi:hypothetical protein
MCGVTAGVEHEPVRREAGFPQRGDDLVGTALVRVGDDDRRTLPGQPPRGGLPDPGTGSTGDHRHPTVEASGHQVLR